MAQVGDLVALKDAEGNMVSAGRVTDILATGEVIVARTDITDSGGAQQLVGKVAEGNLEDVIPASEDGVDDRSDLYADLGTMISGSVVVGTPLVGSWQPVGGPSGGGSSEGFRGKMQFSKVNVVGTPTVTVTVEHSDDEGVGDPPAEIDGVDPVVVPSFPDMENNASEFPLPDTKVWIRATAVATGDPGDEATVLGILAHMGHS